MKIRILNGEKVCAVQDDFNGFISIYNYNDVINSINRIFNDAEKSESIKDGSGDPMNVILIMLAGAYGIQERTTSTIVEKEIIFDDEKKFHKAKNKRFNFTKPAPLKALRIIQGGKV